MQLCSIYNAVSFPGYPYIYLPTSSLPLPLGGPLEMEDRLGEGLARRVKT